MKKVLLFMALVLCMGCGGNTSEKAQKEPVRDTIKVLKMKPVYSKDSVFMAIKFIVRSKDYVDSCDNPIPVDETTIYMRYKGSDGKTSYKKVHELDGGDITFVYTDSTKSRYLYDKRGKHFLRGKEMRAYLSFEFEYF